MKFVDEFRDSAKARYLQQAIAGLAQPLAPRLAQLKRPLQIMEFCGGHTHTIFRYGIQQLLPDWIEMVHGPGCPVCVLPMGRVDDAVVLAQRPEVIFTTFGDAMRVPGSRLSLLQAKALGADIRMAYSPLDALNLARKYPEREVIFFGLGFETTIPSTALTVLQAERDKIQNFSLFCNHLATGPTIKAVLDEPDLKLDGFIAPGHVAMVIGEQPFQFIARDYHKPLVITGFEPLDILQSLWMLLKQFAEERCVVENQYARVVQANGNRAALKAMTQVFELRDFFELRGLGSLPHSGVKMRAEYALYDAEQKFAVPNVVITDPQDCECGAVVKGLIKPWQCKIFGKKCTPEQPMGALMVSSEGACAAYYQHGFTSKVVA